MAAPNNPGPLRFTLLVPTRLFCSVCLVAHVDLPGLPIVCHDIDTPQLDGRAMQSDLTNAETGWIIGKVQPLGVGLIFDGAPPPGTKAQPIAVCPKCKGAR